MNNNKKEELNYHNLNEVIGLSKKMLKILYTCVILAIIDIYYNFYLKI